MIGRMHGFMGKDSVSQAVLGKTKTDSNSGPTSVLRNTLSFLAPQGMAEREAKK